MDEVWVIVNAKGKTVISIKKNKKPPQKQVLLLRKNLYFKMKGVFLF